MKTQINEIKRIQQLAGVKQIHEDFNSPEIVKKDVISLKDNPEELKKWIMRYATSISKGDWSKVETLRIALNTIKEEGIEIK
jgi:hypothetical protein